MVGVWCLVKQTRLLHYGVLRELVDGLVRGRLLPLTSAGLMSTVPLSETRRTCLQAASEAAPASNDDYGSPTTHHAFRSTKPNKQPGTRWLKCRTSGR